MAIPKGPWLMYTENDNNRESNGEEMDNEMETGVLKAMWGSQYTNNTYAGP